MATWDGSYPVSDESNYHPYANQNAVDTRHNTWNYYPVNGNSGFPQATGNFYSQPEPTVYEQNISTPYYQIEPNIPAVSANVTSTEMYQEHLPSTSSYSNNVQCYNNAVNPTQAFVPSQYRNNYSRRPKSKEKKPAYEKRNRNTQSNVSDLNLCPTVDEFVPNGTNLDKGKFNASYKYTNQNNSTGAHYHNANRQSGPSKTFFPSRHKQDRRYDTRKNTYYNQKESSSSQVHENGQYRKNYRSQNSKNLAKSQRDNSVVNNQAVHKTNEENTDTDCRKSFTDATSESSARGESSSSAGLKENQQETNVALKEHMNEGKSTNYTNDILLHASTSKYPYTQSSEFVSDKNIDSTHSQNIRRNSKKKHEGSYREKRCDYQDYNSHKANENRENRIEKTFNKDKIKKKTEGQEKLVQNWRQKETSSDRGYLPRRTYSNKKNDIDDDASQRERLTEQLNKGQLECLVCCEYIRQADYIWSCSNCYHVLHLKCVKKWAKSSQADNGWRCPACQNVNSMVPEDYYCFCGKTVAPEWNRRDIAHSCGEVCGRVHSKNNCVHKCTLLCHPGSCPVCIAMVTKYCGCGKMSQTLQCSTAKLLLCEEICGKPLGCGRHTCEKKCHHGDCEPCEKMLTQECYCGKNTREVNCKAETSHDYSCENVCDKSLDCKNHTCEKLCHPGQCEPCQFVPEKVTTCWCGQTPLTEKRESCLDPIMTCDKTCSKQLKCGQPSKPHTCKAPCHEGECPVCDLTTDVRCRCGNMDREIACKDLTSKADDARCERKCTKKRSCGKHKCNQMCCIDIEHICPLPCNKTLSCGRHKCEQTCHKGRCQPCWRSSFDELYCECGATVIFPPVPCGTRRPTCDKPCSREHLCGHQVLHNCHSDSVCPPCTVLTQKWCYGKHELRKAVPCHVNEISCGLPCNKPISCGRHKCITICHTGPCEKAGQQCVQPCTKPRELCAHMCAAPCHDGPCPDTPCKEMVKVTCQCGHRTSTRVCEENSQEYRRIASSVLASKMADMQLGHLVNLEEVFGQGVKKQNQLKTLECNDECKTIERNRRLALGLQIVNPDLSGKLMPRYSDFMKQWAKKDAHFCQMVHDRLSELVQLAKTSKHKSRSYSFECMNKDKRHFVREYCEHFGCESQAYDEEPKRNVVATAIKDKCWMPSYSLLEIVQRENGQRKVPGPMLNPTKGASSVKTVLSLPSKKSQITLPPPSPSSITKLLEPEIDYFNYKG